MTQSPKGILIGFACLALGASVGYWIGGGGDLTFGLGSSKPKREVVKSRSGAIRFEQLQALGYVDGAYDEDPDASGVLLHDESSASPGYNFYSSRNQHAAQLIDMQGQLVHEWTTENEGTWHHAELLPDGGLLAVVKDRRLDRYDRDSQRMWSVERRFHHDLWVHDGEIYALSRSPKRIEEIHPKLPILADEILVLSMDGEIRREFSVLDVLRRSVHAYLLPSVWHRRSDKEIALDLLHTNHVELFDGSLAHRSPLFQRGNLLISMRNINTLAILESGSLDVLWVWGPTNITLQHHPTLLDTGNILLFDNGAAQSRVLEIDLSGRLVWSYGPMEGFFSETRGSNQRLPNGNTLISESNTGHVFEVTPAGRRVWEFANPEFDDEQVRQAIWRMTRFEPKALTLLR